MKLAEIKTAVLHSIDKDDLGEYVISGTELPLVGFNGNAIAKAVRDTGYPTYLAVAWNAAKKTPIIKYDPEATKGRIIKYLQVYVYEKPSKLPEPEPEVKKEPEKVIEKVKEAKHISEPEPEPEESDELDDAASAQEDFPPVESMKSADIVKELKSLGYTNEDISILDGLATKRQELKNARELGGKL